MTGGQWAVGSGQWRRYPGADISLPGSWSHSMECYDNRIAPGCLVAWHLVVAAALATSHTAALRLASSTTCRVSTA